MPPPTSPESPPASEDLTSSTLTLPDGRKLGYAQYGLLDGRPIILHHGLACSRLDGAAFHKVAQEVGARIIGVDRPGQGLSSPHPDRKLLEFAEDIRVLTEHLQLKEYSVMV
jgi:pimeloyl-ACP methyl ester carboxylesterase